MPAPQEKLTLADIARMAGVGMATASRALNNAPGVAPETRSRVLRTAAEHHYVISPAASSLAGGATRRVAVVVPHLSRWFYATMVETLRGVLADADLDVLLYAVGDRADRRRFFERLPARRQVDALVAVAMPVDEAERGRLERLGVHIVAAGGQHADFPHVCIDDRLAGRRAMQHLVGLGHRTIATIEAVDPDQPVPPLERHHAYDEVMAEAGLPIDPRLRVVTDWGGEEGAVAMEQVLSAPVRPTAVYAHSDEVALGAVRTIRRAGLRVPEDISVVGIDDHPLASLTELTTVHQPVVAQGERAGRMLLDLLQTGETAQTSVVLPTRLVVRRTTAPPPA